MPATRIKRSVRLLAQLMLVLGCVITACVSMSGAQAAAVRHAPLAYLEAPTVSPGHIGVRGWTFDPDALGTPLTVDVTLDGRAYNSLRADAPRPDVVRAYASVYPRLTTNHGLTLSIPTSDGTHKVCFTARNVGLGTNVAAGCRTVTVRDSPLAQFEPLVFSPGHVAVSGWAFDPNALTTPLTVTVTMDGQLWANLTANGNRPDVARAYASRYPGLTAAHGFAASLAVQDGTHQICIVARNIGYGADIGPACRSITVRESPLAYLEPLRHTPGHIAVSGWAFDPDGVTTPLQVAVTLNGAAYQTVTASGSRPDVARAYAGGYPGLTAGHGYALSIPVSDGTYQVCATAKNISYGTDQTACRTIAIRETPLAQLDSVSQAPGSLAVRGWAFDPDMPATAVTVSVTLDNKAYTQFQATAARPDVANTYGPTYPGLTPYHGFALNIPVGDGTHTVCITARNLGPGKDYTAPCKTLTVRFEPTTVLTAVTPTPLGVLVTGWTSDPDTTAPIDVQLTIDGQRAAVLTANGKTGASPGHGFTASLPATSGTHQVCAAGLNVGAGSNTPSPVCQTVTLALRPFGHFDSLQRASGSTNIVATGWAADPDALTKPISISISVDGGTPTVTSAQATRADVGQSYPLYGAAHGFSVTLPTDDGEHTVCITALNVGGGSDTNLGCRLIIAVNPTAPSAPQNVTAVTGFGGATITWQPPQSDGGAPVTGYIISDLTGTVSSRVPAGTTSTVVLGLRASARYAFTVAATNQVGTSALGTSPVVLTPAAPPPQTSPAPISTSRYIRNVRGSSATDLATMQAEGLADARANPSGHGYLILLDIGGQDQLNGGVVLSATTRFVSYADLVACLKSYVAGYAAGQKPSAPVTIAIGTNNDMDVSATSGKQWASLVVNPVVSYARQFPGITIAGANDVEPGFRRGYTQTSQWLGAFLGATSAPFVFNGSADGCSWASTGSSCNNGWTMSGLYQLAAGASPTRIINLPQIYNNTMAAQWKYISLTGVAASKPRINFGGALTEWTACSQARSCGSLTGNEAWTQLWNQLQSHPSLRISSLPYSTDLRIDS